MLLPWSPPAETLLWFLLLGCVSAMPVCWAGWGGWSGAAAGEADQGRFLLQAPPLLGQHDHLQRVLPVPLPPASSTSLGQLSALTGCSRGGRTATAPRALRSSVPSGEALQKRGCWWPGAGKQWRRRVTKHRGVRNVPGRQASPGEPRSWLSAGYSLARELGLLRTAAAATLLRHSSFSQSWYQPLLEGWRGGRPGWDHLLSCSCSAQGWAGPCVPAAPCRKEWDIQHQARSSAQLTPGQGWSLPGQAVLVLELSR